MKKFFYLLVAVATAFTFVACDGGNKTIEQKFNITIGETTATKAAISVSVTDTNSYYLAALLAKEDLVDLDINELWAENLEYYNEMIDLYAAYGIDVTIYDFLWKGNVSTEATGLTPSTDYAVVAFPIDSVKLEVYGNYASAEFSTSAVKASTLKLTLTPSADGKIQVVASNNDPYFFWVEDKEEYDEYVPNGTQAEKNEEIDAWIYTVEYNGYDPAAFCYTGSGIIDAAEYVELENGVEYVVLAAPYSEVRNGDCVVAEFTYQGGAKAPARFADGKEQLVRQAKKPLLIKNIVK